MTQPSPEYWDLWQDGPHDPPFNMAADEVLLETAVKRGRPLLRFYSWDRLAVSIGYVQKLSAAPEGFAVVRRPTGGGVVYHDFDFTYTVVFPEGHWLTGLDRTQSYDWINRSVQAALEELQIHANLSNDSISHDVDRMTMVCFKNPTKYDVLLDGNKIAGSAQRRTVDGILHQGSLHFGGPLPFTREQMSQAMTDAFSKIMFVSFIPYTPDGDLQSLFIERRDCKFATEAWNAKR